MITRTPAARTTTQDPAPRAVCSGLLPPPTHPARPPRFRVGPCEEGKPPRPGDRQTAATGPDPRAAARPPALTVALQDLVLEAAGVVDELLQAALAQLPVARELVQHLLQLALHRHALIHAGDRGARRSAASRRPGPHRGRVLLLVPQGGGRRGKLRRGGRASRGAGVAPRSPCPPAPWRPGPAARALSPAPPGAAASRPGPPPGSPRSAAPRRRRRLFLFSREPADDLVLPGGTKSRGPGGGQASLTSGGGGAGRTKRGLGAGCVCVEGGGSRGRARAEGRAGVLKAWAVPRGRRPGSAARAERAARLVGAAEQGTSARASTTRPVNKRVETVPGDSAPKRKANQWTRALGQRRTPSNPWPRRKTSANPG